MGVRCPIMHRTNRLGGSHRYLNATASRGISRCILADYTCRENLITLLLRNLLSVIVMKNTFKLLFYIKRSALLKNGEAPVMLRITIGGERACVSTHVTVAPEKWNRATGSIVGRTAKAKAANEMLDSIRYRIYRSYVKLTADDNAAITPKRLRREFYDNSGGCAKLLVFFRNHNEDFRRMVGVCRSINTYNKYRTVYGHLEKFVKSHCRKADIALCDIDRNFIVEFHSWLQSSLKRRNTVWLYMIAFKHILSLAATVGYLDPKVYSGHRLTREVVHRTYLTKDELVHVVRRSGNIVGRTIRIVFDAFLFSCFTGLSYIDMIGLRSENIQHIDGEVWIVSRRTKTGVPVNIRLFGIAAGILSAYMHPNAGESIFSLPSNGVCNKYIGIIMHEMGIFKHITFHSARHTFATTVALSNGMTIEVISNLLGHKNISTTQIYATVNRSLVAEAMNRLSENIDSVYSQIDTCGENGLIRVF